MGYAVYEDRENGRWAGYGVPAECDVAGCAAEIDRGLDYKCETYIEYLCDGTEKVEVEGCGLFFCPDHQRHGDHEGAEPKPDSAEWVHHLLTDESWAQWREENPAEVARLEEG